MQTNWMPLASLIKNFALDDVWSRLFSAARERARQIGIEPMLGDFESLAQLSHENQDSWHPLIPTFASQFNDLTNTDSFCIFGVDSCGDVVVTHAARRFAWVNTNFTREAESLRMFYSDPDTMKYPGEAWRVTAPNAGKICGCVVYSGAAWIHPSYRARALSAIFPRIGKAYAYLLWQPDFIISLMTEDNYRRGLAPRTGYSTAEWAVDVHNSRIGTGRFALLSMRKQCILDYATALVQ